MTSPGSKRHTVPRAGVAIGAALFLIGSTVSVVLLNEVNDSQLWLLLGPQLLGCLALGWFLRSWAWAAPAVAVIPGFLAAPFGVGEFAESPSLAFIELIVAPASLVAILLGAGARTLVSRRLPCN